MKKSSSAIIGACGEHYVAAYLSGHRLLVALPRAGVKGSDLFVANADSGRPLRIQVKTGTQAKGKYKGELIYSWDTSFPPLELYDATTWYAYVWLNGWPQKAVVPEVFFVPSSNVASCLEKELEASAGKKPWRTFFWMRVDEAAKYKDENGLKLLTDAMATGCLDQVLRRAVRSPRWPDRIPGSLNWSNPATTAFQFITSKW